jgi:hypothetical protein
MMLDPGAAFPVLSSKLGRRMHATFSRTGRQDNLTDRSPDNLAASRTDR